LSGAAFAGSVAVAWLDLNSFGFYDRFYFGGVRYEPVTPTSA
jgi:hypothetical protein